MNFIVAVAIAFPIIQNFGAQAVLSIVTFDIEVSVADPEYFRDPEVYIEDEGKDNEFFINFTLIKSLPEEATNHFKLIGASMGEYVVQTGFDFTIKLCDAIKEPIFGGRLYKAMGLDKDVCPALPGVYGGSHINLIDEETLPETFPPNNYMVVLSAPYQGKILYQIKAYFKIQ